MDVIYLIGRVVLSAVFLLNGVNHLRNTDASAGYAQFKGVPSPRNAVLASGVGMIAGSVGIILGIWMDLAAWGMAVFVVLAAVMMHRYWEVDDDSKPVEMAQFWKNISLAGGALVIAATAEGADYTITDALF